MKILTFSQSKKSPAISSALRSINASRAEEAITRSSSKLKIIGEIASKAVNLHQPITESLIIFEYDCNLYLSRAVLFCINLIQDGEVLLALVG